MRHQVRVDVAYEEHCKHKTKQNKKEISFNTEIYFAIFDAPVGFTVTLKGWEEVLPDCGSA